MQQDREVSVNWLRVNVPSVVSIVAATVIIVGYVQDLKGRVDSIEVSRSERSTSIAHDLDTANTRLDALSNLPLRMDIAEKNIAAINARFDQFMATFGQKLDGISDRVGGLTTKVEVLSQKIDALTPEKRAEFSGPPLGALARE